MVHSKTPFPYKSYLLRACCGILLNTQIPNLNRDIGNYVDDVPPPGTIEFRNREYILSFLM